MLNVPETAKRLGVKPATIYALCAAGKIEHFRVGLGRGSIRIEPAAIAAYLDGQRVPVRDEPDHTPARRRHWSRDWDEVVGKPFLPRT